MNAQAILFFEKRIIQRRHGTQDVHSHRRKWRLKLPETTIRRLSFFTLFLSFSEMMDYGDVLAAVFVKIVMHASLYNLGF
jgi:hypothetical protein